MAAPHVSSVSPVRPTAHGEHKASFAELRRLIHAIERATPSVGGSVAGPAAELAAPLGLAVLDQALPAGGLVRGALHEVRPANPSGADAGASAGFLSALLVRLLAGEASGPVLWCLGAAGRRETGRPYGPGLAAFGLDPNRLLFAWARRDADVLWAMREGLGCSQLAAVIGETEAMPDLAASRRLQLAAGASGVTAILLGRRALGSEPSAALTRWRVAAMGSEHVPGEGVGRPRWQVALERCRGGVPHDWVLEWRDETGDFALAAALSGRSAEPAQARLAG